MPSFRDKLRARLMPIAFSDFDALCEWEDALLAICNDMATGLDAAWASKEAMHRRAQKAEGQLAARPSNVLLTEALIELKQAKSDRHRLRGEVAFLKAQEARTADFRRSGVVGLLTEACDRLFDAELEAAHGITPNPAYIDAKVRHARVCIINALADFRRFLPESATKPATRGPVSGAGGNTAGGRGA